MKEDRDSRPDVAGCSSANSCSCSCKGCRSDIDHCGAHGRGCHYGCV